jgi:mRNA-degrading endonuclease toxin of MazEF toxin-antitoxin module
MKPFEVYSWQPPGWPEAHPCVIVSHPARAASQSDVEVLLCSTKPANRKPGNTEVILDQADGMDRLTLCKCDLIYTVPRDKIKNRRGQVSPLRRPQLIRTLIAAHAWGEILAG